MNFRKPLSLILIISLFFLHTPSAQAADRTCAQGGECAIGDVGPGGGKVFFVKQAGSFLATRTFPPLMCMDFPCFGITYQVVLTEAEQAALPFDYLEVAPTQSEPLTWATDGAITGGTSSKLGTGETNTANIMTTFPSGNSTNNAAHFAHNYSNNSKSDWFLPSYDELLLVILLSGEPTPINLGTFDSGLWSSTTGTTTSARYSYSLNRNGLNSRATTMKAVAIRAFSKSDLPAEASPSSDPEALRREAEKKREEAVRAAQRSVVQKVAAKGTITKSDLKDIDAPNLSEATLNLVNKELSNSDSATPTDINKINVILNKYKLYDQIQGNIVGQVSARELVSSGIIATDTPMKTLTTAKLLALPLDQRDTVDEINAFYAQAKVLFLARKERLAAIIEKIQNRG
jgi:hypothetical protein